MYFDYWFDLEISIFVPNLRSPSRKVNLMRVSLSEKVHQNAGALEVLDCLVYLSCFVCLRLRTFESFYESVIFECKYRPLFRILTHPIYFFLSS